MDLFSEHMDDFSSTSEYRITEKNFHQHIPKKTKFVTIDITRQNEIKKIKIPDSVENLLLDIGIDCNLSELNLSKIKVITIMVRKKLNIQLENVILPESLKRLSIFNYVGNLSNLDNPDDTV